MKKRNKINILYWINLISWILIAIFRLWNSHFTRLCGDPCEKCLKIIPKTTSASTACDHNSFYLFWKHNYNLIENFFLIWFLITLVSSIIVLIVLIKRKELKKAAIGTVVVLALLFGPQILIR